MRHTIYRSPGKLLLFGEHVVLDGAPALTTTLDMEFIAQWAIKDEGFELFLGEPNRNTVLEILDLLWDSVGLEKPLRGYIGIASTIPIGQGFGSSAALCAAFAYLVRNVKEGSFPNFSMIMPTIRPETLSMKDRVAVWTLANEAEQLIHGKASGIDTGAVLHPGLTCFVKQRAFPPKAKQLETLGVWLVYGNVPRTVEAKTCIAHVQAQKKSAAYQKLAEIADAAADTMENGKGKKRILILAKLANDTMDCFEKLDILSKSMERLHEVALRSGALGGKMCGAGAGGAFWYLAKTREQAVCIRDALLAFPACSFVNIKPI